MRQLTEQVLKGQNTLRTLSKKLSLIDTLLKQNEELIKETSKSSPVLMKKIDDLNENILILRQKIKQLNLSDTNYQERLNAIEDQIRYLRHDNTLTVSEVVTSDDIILLKEIMNNVKQMVHQLNQHIWFNTESDDLKVVYDMIADYIQSVKTYRDEVYKQHETLQREVTSTKVLVEQLQLLSENIQNESDINIHLFREEIVEKLNRIDLKLKQWVPEVSDEEILLTFESDIEATIESLESLTTMFDTSDNTNEEETKPKRGFLARLLGKE